mgnify:CR=1 FL=1
MFKYDEDNKRFYPYENLASHLIGFCGTDNQGLEGIEASFNNILTGRSGKIITTIDLNNSEISDNHATYVEVENGNDVYLTIDANLQRIAEDALEANIMKIREGGFGKQYDADGGSVIVTSVKTGEVLAMASYPDYEPSYFYDGISTEQWREYSTNPYKPLTNNFH